MRSSFTQCLTLTLILTLHGLTVRPILAGTGPHDPANPNLRVHVLLYNYASVPAEKLARAEEVANRIFRQEGVEVVWVENTSLAKGPSAPTLENMDLILRVLPQPRATLESRSTLGEALSCGLSREGCFASVFLNRVTQLRDQTRISLHQVLGHAMAHELGHLLLGSNSHSDWGLMRARWTPEDLQRAAKGNLLFTSEEAEGIRQRVLARIQQREMMQASALPR